MADELERLATEDRTVRERLAATGELFHGYNSEMQSVHRRNGDRLAEILDDLAAWPGYQVVGKEGSGAAFQIAQHAISNPPLMRRCRDLYGAAVAHGDADPAGFAYLDDRIRAFEGLKQRYGTQLGWNDDGEFGCWPPLDEPDNVDERRAEVGLAPITEALDGAASHHPPRRSPSSVRNERRDAERFARRAGWRSTTGPG
jgi:hypothetical protein